MKKKNLPMNMLHTFLLCIMFFLLAGLTSCRCAPTVLFLFIGCLKWPWMKKTSIVLCN